MYGENTKTIAIPIYRVLPYPVISTCMSSVYNIHALVVVCVCLCMRVYVHVCARVCEYVHICNTQ